MASKVEVPKELENKLSEMGYCAPNWDEFTFLKPPSTTLAIYCPKPTEFSKKQLFLINVWPKVERFFQEEEDPVILERSQTIIKNGFPTRFFRFYFDDLSDQRRWEFLLEKSIDVGTEGLKRNIRQTWALCDHAKLPKLNKTLVYSRSFDTHCQSSNGKANSEPGVVSALKKNFFAEIRTFLISSFEDSPSIADDDKRINSSNNNSASLAEFLKGKQLEFEECGNQIFWTVSIRTNDKNTQPENSWKINPGPGLLSRISDVLLRSRNPFLADEEDIHPLEVLEIERQVVENNILCFMNYLWPKVRNFFLQIQDNHEDFHAVITTENKNVGCVKSLELHFDTLNERNRWKFLFEIVIATKIWDSDPKNAAASEYIEKRTYSSFEKRGTSSIFGEDKSPYFCGFYKHWFLNELQWKLAKCYVFDGKSFESPLDPSLFDFGKELDFSINKDLVTWCFSVQKISKYPIDNVPENIWCYRLTNNFLYGEDNASVNSEFDRTLPSSGDSTDFEADFSFASTMTNLSSVTLAEKIKKKSKKFRTLTRNVVQPLMKKPVWLTSTAKLFQSRSRKNLKDEH